MKYFTRQELESSSPSLKDGVDAAKDKQLRKTYLNFIKQLVKALKLSAITQETAAVFAHRFFALRSYSRNDRFLVAACSVFLACKVDESPRSLRDVAFVMHRTKYANKPEELEKLRQEQTLVDLMEQLLQVERAMLYTLAFNLNVDHPYTHLAKGLEALGVDYTEKPHKTFFQQTNNMLNDSLATTLSLQYNAKKLAYAAMHEVARLMSYTIHIPNGMAFCGFFEITQAEIDDIVPQLLALYDKRPTKAAAGTTPAPTGDATGPHSAPAPAPVPSARPGPPMPSFRPIILTDDGQAQPARPAADSTVADVEEGELPPASTSAAAAGSSDHAKGSAPASVPTPTQQHTGLAGGSGRGVASPLMDSDGEDGIGHAPGSGDQNNHNESDRLQQQGTKQQPLSRKRTRSPGGLEEGEIGGIRLPKSPCLRSAA